MLPEILKSFLIGICASAPIGPVAILVIQKTLSKGHGAGFLTGLGAACVDTTYAAIAIFALAIAKRFMSEHNELILLLGGLLICLVGFSMARSKPLKRVKSNPNHSNYSAKDFFQAMATGLSNPGAILVMFGLFTFFGVGKTAASEDWRVFPIILAVFCGAATYWYTLTSILSHFGKKIEVNAILWINRIAGTVVMVIGVVLVFRGAYMLITA